MPRGLAVWLGVMVAAGLGVWFLAKAFPGRINGREDVADVVRFMLLIGLVTAGLTATRYSARSVVRYGAGWLAIIAILALGYSFRGELRLAGERVRDEFAGPHPMTVAPGEMVVSQDTSGHFVLYAKVNGVTLPFLADTGASEIVLSPAAAAQLGLDVDQLDYSSVAQTANGIGRSAPFTADSLEVGDLRLSDVPMEVNQAPMSHSLLGMSFFRRLHSFRVEGGRLYMRWGG